MFSYLNQTLHTSLHGIALKHSQSYNTHIVHVPLFVRPQTYAKYGHQHGPHGGHEIDSGGPILGPNGAFSCDPIFRKVGSCSWRIRFQHENTDVWL